MQILPKFTPGTAHTLSGEFLPESNAQHTAADEVVMLVKVDPQDRLATVQRPCGRILRVSVDCL